MASKRLARLEYSDVPLRWLVYTPGLLKEILNNPGAEILCRPLQIFYGILAQVADRASQLNDPILNDLMCRLALYEVADPTSKNYDPKKLEAVAKLAYETLLAEECDTSSSK